MERVVHRAKGFQAAARWDLEQHLSMTAEERLQAARELRLRAFGPDSRDVREAERAR
ncbi:MAG: hypothetical protein HY722_03990 [Planctomycetes bacterium]|nr:hypothetical protein [Planctomycetota bacterium]